MSTPEDRAGWKKSSHSNTGNGCVEVFRTLRAIRDSKQPGGPELTGDARVLAAMLRSGRLGAGA